MIRSRMIDINNLPVYDGISSIHVDRSDEIDESCISLTHKSGLKILLCPKARSGVSAALAVRYGSIDIDISDRYSSNNAITPYGAAHFLEHQLFSAGDGHDIQDDFSKIGAEVNAFTTYDRTAYTFNSAYEYENALRLLIGMVISPSFSSESVEKERGIITEEILMNYDSPWERCYSELLQAMYSIHPLREDICGTEDSIKRITPEILYACHKRFYDPCNMVLSISGDVDPEPIVNVCNEVLDGFSVSDFGGSPKRVFSEPYDIYRKQVSVDVPAQKPAFCIGIKDVPLDICCGKALLKKDITLSMLCDMLFSRTEGFYNSLFEDGIISPDFSHSSSLGDGFSFVSLSGEADDPSMVYEYFCKHISKLCKDGLSRASFERNRRIMYADFITGFDSTEDISNNLINYAIDGISPFDFLREIRELSFDDICDLFYSISDDKKFVLSVARCYDVKE